MSINKANAGGVSAVILFNGERILIYYDGCEFKVKKSNGDIPHFQGTKKGRVYLTTHRVIFINSNQHDLLQSMSMPFSRMTGVDIKQPIFGANSVVGNIRAEEGWEGTASFSLTFNNGGAIEFGRALLEVGKRASAARFEPPPYVPMPPLPQYYAAPPPAYTPPYADPYYGQFVPQHSAFGMPPNGAVYVMAAPPPYPGAGPAPPYFPPNEPPPYPVQSNTSFGSAADQKAAEANAVESASGYYNPNSNGHQVYASAPPMPTAPPSYEAATKKHD